MPTVAIVGGGPSAISFICQLVEIWCQCAMPKLNIILVSKDREIGPGLAYSSKLSGTILNMHATTMSIDPRDETQFAVWLEQKLHGLANGDWESSLMASSAVELTSCIPLFRSPGRD